MDTMVDETLRWRVIGYCEKVYQACQGAPVQAAGSCERCGQGIRWVVTLKSTNGDVINVGTDCATTLEGGPELHEIRNAERAYERAEYLRIHGPRIAAERKEREEKEAAAKAHNLIHNGLTMEGLRIVKESEKSSEYERNFAAIRLKHYETGHLTGDLHPEEMLKVWKALVNIFAVESNHVGQVGGKVQVKATLEAFIVVCRDSQWGPKYLHKFRTAEGNVLTWFATGSAGAIPEDVGKAFVIKGSVKEHSLYQGVKQTILTRCKLS